MNINSENVGEHIKSLKLKYPKQPSIAYLNINSIRNKFEELKIIVKKNIDILIIADTKIDESFPTNQFKMDGYRTPYRYRTNENVGGLLIYINENIPSKELTGFKIPNDIQMLPIEINLRKQKWLMLPYYRRPITDPGYFLKTLGSTIEHYSPKRDNIIAIGDLNKIK